MSEIIWITRTQPGATRSARRWRAAGFTPVTAPVLEVEGLPSPQGVPDNAVLAFTSAHAVRHCPTARRHHPVYAVGEATADAARAAGFTEVHSAGGNVNDLAQAIEKTKDPVVHLSGDHVAGDLVGALRSRGLNAERKVVYRTLSVQDPLGSAAVPDAIAAYSPRGAALVEDCLAATWQGTIFALSPAVAEPFIGRRVIVAEKPTETALIRAACSAGWDAAPFASGAHEG